MSLPPRPRVGIVPIPKQHGLPEDVVLLGKASVLTEA